MTKMKISAHGHMNIGDQIANAVVHSATSHSVGALMRGHSVGGVIVIAVVLIAGIWVFRRLF